MIFKNVFYGKKSLNNDIPVDKSSYGILLSKEPGQKKAEIIMSVVNDRDVSVRNEISMMEERVKGNIADVSHRIDFTEEKLNHRIEKMSLEIKNELSSMTMKIIITLGALIVGAVAFLSYFHPLVR